MVETTKTGFSLIHLTIVSIFTKTKKKPRIYQRISLMYIKFFFKPPIYYYSTWGIHLIIQKNEYKEYQITHTF